MTKQRLFLILLLPFFLAACAGGSGETLPLITPTIYYKPIIYKEKETCSSADLKDLVDENGKTLVSLCKKSYDNCLMQGSCLVVQGEKTRSFNFTKNKNGVRRFAEKREERCPYGYGVRNICMDPFYSVAADLSIHSVGDVIFIPYLVGTVLPDGSKHNGYLIVRDEGSAIVGEHRFDFFTGFFSPYDSKNVFADLGFGDKGHRFGYQKMNEDVAKAFREYRNYPNIP